MGPAIIAHVEKGLQHLLVITFVLAVNAHPGVQIDSHSFLNLNSKSVFNIPQAYRTIYIYVHVCMGVPYEYACIHDHA